MRTLCNLILAGVLMLPASGCYTTKSAERVQRDEEQARTPAHEAQRQAPATPYKDPQLATVLSALLVGAGQFYAGDADMGQRLVVTSVVAVWTGSAFSENSARRGEVNNTPIYIGLGVSGLAWLYGVIDAGNAARRYNARVDAALSPVAIGTADGVRPGLSLHVGF